MSKPFGFIVVIGRNWRGDPSYLTTRGTQCWQSRRIGDAKVYKRESNARRDYPSLEILPIYSDPRSTGNKALIS